MDYIYALFSYVPTWSEVLAFLDFTPQDVLLLASTLVIYLPFVIAPMFAFFGKTAGIVSVLVFLLSVFGYWYGIYPYEFVDSLGLHRLFFDFSSLNQDILQSAEEATR